MLLEFGLLKLDAAVSLLVLFLMLAAVIITVAANGWRLTKGLGATMFVLYAVFVVQDLARTYRWF